MMVNLPKEAMEQYQKLQQEDTHMTDNLDKLTAQLDIELHKHRSKYITRKELSGLPETTTVYRALGKAFILDNHQNTMNQLRSDLAHSDKIIHKIKKMGVHFQGKSDEIRSQMNEVIKPYIQKQ